MRAGVVAQFVALSLIWGSTWLVIKDQIGDVPVEWSVSYRFLVAGGAMALLCVVLRKTLRLPRSGHALALLVAATQFVANFNLVYRSELYLTSGLVALIFSLIVVPNTVLARVFLGQRIAPAFVAGSVLGIAGVALLVGRDLDVKGADAGFGLALACIAVLCASAGNVLQATGRARALPLEALLAWGLTYGGILSAALAWASAGPPQFDLRPSYAAGIVYLALIASTLAFRLYYSMIREIGPARSAFVNVVVPVVAMTLSTIFEGFVWTWTAGAGAVLTLIGLVIALRSRS
ncbi:DMT family transporter [Glacieibacterium frigidum]|uniref:DMT family transporter n=1 Tax=Glacieibacterium frigidum TaxID=2593303 RepID=A0A552UAP1_9SPHN|nr:DMT family transporter [Glacieibacterium frigidum]